MHTARCLCPQGHALVVADSLLFAQRLSRINCGEIGDCRVDDEDSIIGTWLRGRAWRCGDPSNYLSRLYCDSARSLGIYPECKAP